MGKLTILAGLTLVGSLFSTASLDATTLIVPGANATLESEQNVNSPFGNSNTNGFVVQLDYAASLFSSIASGTMITGIGFRLYSEDGTPAQDLHYTSFNVQIGASAKAPSGLSKTFASNLGADTVMARSGALTIAAGTFVGDQLVNPFYTINFTTPYAYQGSDLLITIRDTLADDTVGQFVPLDAVAHSASLGSVGTGGAASTKGAANFFYIPVTQLTFASTAVPEPASWVLMIGGFGLVGGTMRRRAMTTVRAV